MRAIISKLLVVALVATSALSVPTVEAQAGNETSSRTIPCDGSQPKVSGYTVFMSSSRNCPISAKTADVRSIIKIAASTGQTKFRIGIFCRAGNGFTVATVDILKRKVNISTSAKSCGTTNKWPAPQAM